MRLAGVPEQLVTGDADPWERFAAWAATVPRLIRNPLYVWTHLELRRVFGIDLPLGPVDGARDLGRGQPPAAAVSVGAARCSRTSTSRSSRPPTTPARARSPTTAGWRRWTMSALRWCPPSDPTPRTRLARRSSRLERVGRQPRDRGERRRSTTSTRCSTRSRRRTSGWLGWAAGRATTGSLPPRPATRPRPRRCASSARARHGRAATTTSARSYCSKSSPSPRGWQPPTTRCCSSTSGRSATHRRASRT